MELEPLVLSFEVAAVATVLAGAIGISIGLLFTWRRLHGRDFLDALATAPMVMPPTVLGYYVLVALGRSSAIGRAYEAVTGSPIVFTRTGAIVAATIGSLPLVIKSARAALDGVDPTLTHAARTLGAGPVRAFFTVQLPLASRGLYAAVTLAFARALGDFGITLMVGGDIPGETHTAALAVYDAMQAGRDRDAAGMVAILTSVCIVAVYAVNRWTRKRHD